MLTPSELSHCFIDGKWQPAISTKQFSVCNPATQEAIGWVPDCDEQDTELAIAAAQTAFHTWRQQTAKQRADLLMGWRDLILANESSLAQLMTLECGKPIAESEREVRYAASFIQWFSEEAKRVRGDLIPEPSKDRRLLVQKQPVGVCAAITPWNFPLAMIARKCAPALASGCTVIIKPAEQTPLSALAIAKLAELAGIPDGVFNVITTSQPDKVGAVLASHPLVRKISFTGSTGVGKKLLGQAAQTVKSVSMELGGNAPFIIFDDADLESSIKGAISSKFRNNGQTCVCANRFIVHESLVERFAQLLAQQANQLIVGDGQDRQTELGPLINQTAVGKLDRLLEDALSKGAKLVTGGGIHPAGPLFYKPTVITGVNTAMDIAHEEIFGPIAPVYSFATEQQAIQLANATPYGLAAYFFTSDISRMFRVSDALDFGMVGINEGVMSSEMAPFGGMKESGLGREGSHYGIDEYLEVKYLCLGGLS
ncbi:MAG: NAD-dependent succinate-semialdehyde dehydrogenase [Reinekea sp.]|nr:NAD-dependent succinate-semialdehyde dehydrogenase [Reinekea sp.]